MLLLIYTVLIIKCVVLSNGAIVSKLEEVKSLRSELNEKLNPQLTKATPDKQAEIDSIRNEILNAVKNHEYKYKSSSPSEMVGSPLWHQLPLGNPKKVNDSDKENMVGQKAYAFKFLDKFNLNANSYRDVLDITEVHEDYNFTLERKVTVWKHIPNSLHGHQVLVGLTKSSLIVVKEKNGSFNLTAEIKLKGDLSEIFETVFQWNNVKGVAEGFVVVGIDDNLVWISMGDKFDQLQIAWKWHLSKKFTMIKPYKFEDQHLIFISSLISKGSSQTSVDIYQYDLDHQEFWLLQLIQTRSPCYSLAVLEWRKHMIIAIPIENETLIYNYANEKFILDQKISSKNVTTVAGFQIGGLCYFAIGGSEPKIIRFRNHKLHQVPISEIQYSFVKKWLPISVHTFREDIVLLAQVEVPFDTHTLIYIAPLRWNGDKFETIFDVPCYMEEKLHHAGISCMIDFDKRRGLRGATVLTSDDKISILVPRNKDKSGLYNLKFEIRPAPHPKEDQLIEIQMMFDYFSRLKEYSSHIVEKAEKVLTNVVKPNQINKVTGNFKIDELVTDQVEIRNLDKTLEINGRNIDEYNLELNKDDLLLTLQDNVDEILKIEKEIQDIKSSSRYLVRGSANGQFDIQTLKVLKKVANVDDRSRVTRQANYLNKLEIDNIDFDFINGIPKDDLLFSDDEDIHLDNPLRIKGSLEVLENFDGKVNDIDLLENINFVGSDQVIDNLYFKELDVENIKIDQSINDVPINDFLSNSYTKELPKLEVENLIVKNGVDFEFLNDLLWNDLLGNLVLPGDPNISEIIVTGNVIAEDSISIETLNGIEFPGGFLWNNEEEAIVVHGRKNFTNLVVTNAVDADRYIDGVDMEKVILLDGVQFIPNETIFHQIEVTDHLETFSDTSIVGPHLDEFLSNPTLLQTRRVQATCMFKNLHVRGNIIVRDTINDIIVDELLSNAVYKDDDGPIPISGYTEFENVTFLNPIILDTGLLNNVPIEDYVTKSTDQKLELSTIENGHILFDNLELDGLFDFVNVTNLDLTTIKTYGEQFTESELIFHLPDKTNKKYFDISADHLTVKETLNSYDINEFIDTSEDVTLNGKFEFDNLEIRRLYLDGQLVGKPLINGVSLERFDHDRLSISRDQIISTPAKIRHLNVNEIHVHSLNDHNWDDIESQIYLLENFETLLKEGKLPIDDLYVSGNVSLNYINDVNLNELLKNVVWLNQTNIFVEDVTFLDETTVEGKIQLDGGLNNEWNFLENIVWRNEKYPIYISGFKTFKKAVTVKNDLITDQINDIPVKNLLTKYQHHLNGKIKVHGDLNVGNLEGSTYWQLAEDFTVQQLIDMYTYDFENYCHVIKNHLVQMIDHPRVDNLYVGGALNNIEHIGYELQKIIRKDNDKVTLTGPIHFKDEVIFEDLLNVDYMDGIDLKNYFENAVLISQGYETEINGTVEFKKPFFANTITANEVLVEDLNGCSIKEMISNSVLKNQDYDFKGHYEFHGPTFFAKNIEVDYLNTVPFSHFITRHTPQNFTGMFHLQNVFSNSAIDVYGKVNGYNLPEERKNTLETFSEFQSITSQTTFQNVGVIKSLTTNGTVNNHDLRNVILTSAERIYIRSPVSFKHLISKNLYTDHLISGIHIPTWIESSLKYRDPSGLQTVTGDWSFDTLNVTNDISGFKLVNGIEVDKLIYTLHENKEKITEFEQNFKHDYKELCEDVKKLIKEKQRRPCIFKYFEYNFTIPSLDPINSFLFFSHHSKEYLIYSTGCLSYLLKWEMELSKFSEVAIVRSGSVNRWILLSSSHKETVLISQNNHFNCENIYPNSVWSWNGYDFKVVSKISDNLPVNDIQVTDQNGDYFYILDNDRNVVNEVQAQTGNITDEWILNADEKYRFLPNEASLGLALGDGSQITVLKPMQREENHRRHKRYFTKKFRLKMEMLSEAIKQIKSEELWTEDTDNKFHKMSLLDRIKLRFVQNKIKLAQILELFSSSSSVQISNTHDDLQFDDSDWGEHTILNDTRKLKSQDQILITNTTENKMQNINNQTENHLRQNDDPNLQIQSHQRKNPEVGGAIFDNIQNGISGTANRIVDVSSNVLKNADEVVNLDKVFDRIDEVRNGDPNLQMQENQKNANPEVGGAIFDNIQNGISGAANRIVDVSSNVFKNADEVVDMDKVFDRIDEVRNGDPNLQMQENQKNANPEVGGAIFDNIQNGISGAANRIVDVSSNVLKNADEVVDMDKVFDRIDEVRNGDPNLQMQENQKNANPEVGGAIFDNIQNGISGAANRVVDVSSNVLKNADEVVDMDKVFDRIDEVRNGDPNLQMQENQKNANPEVGGAIFDNIQNGISGAANRIVDVSSNVLKNADEVVDMDKVLDRIDEVRNGDPNLQMQENQKNANPEVGGAIFDNIQNGISGAANRIVDVSSNVLKNADEVVDMDKVFDRIDEVRNGDPNLQMQENQKNANPEVGGAIFDNIQNGISGAANRVVDVSSNVLKNADEVVDLDKVFDRIDEVRNGDSNLQMHKNHKNANPKVGGDKILDLDTILQPSKNKSDHKDVSQSNDKLNDQLNDKGPNKKLEIGSALFGNQYVITKGGKGFVNFTSNAKKDQDGFRSNESDHSENEHDHWNQNIARVLDGKRMFITSNKVIPGKDQGEIVVLTVGLGINRRNLIGVSRSTPIKIKGSNDAIYLYEDIVEEKLYQTIPCHKPSSLTALHLKDETLLLFMERQTLLQIYAYRGLMGFVKFMEVDFKAPVFYMNTIQLPESNHNCITTFLVIAMANEIQFLRAETNGNCLQVEEMECEY